MHHSFQMLYSSSYNKNNTTLADRLLVPDGIIRPVVVSSVSVFLDIVSNQLKWPPLLSNDLYYVTLI